MSTTDRPVLVVGAGIAGVACARAVAAAGHRVRVIDRGRRPGGRMASRRLDGRPVDLGASYLTVSGAPFGAVVRAWADAGLAHPWTDTFDVVTPQAPPEPKQGPLRWGAPHGLRSLVEDLAADLDVVSGVAVQRVERDADGLLVDGERASAVVLAMPDAQATRLLGEGLGGVRGRLDRAWEPILAVAARWPERCWGDDLDGAFVNDHPAVSFVADDGRRRGDGAPVLVAHSTGELAAEHLAEPEGGRDPVVRAVVELLGVPHPTTTHLHRWTLARPLGERPDPFLLDGRRPGELLGVCGDGWGDRPKVEGAWSSGTALGAALADRLADERSTAPGGPTAFMPAGGAGRAPRDRGPTRR